MFHPNKADVEVLRRLPLSFDKIRARLPWLDQNRLRLRLETLLNVGYVTVDDVGIFDLDDYGISFLKREMVLRAGSDE